VTIKSFITLEPERQGATMKKKVLRHHFRIKKKIIIGDKKKVASSSVHVQKC
jgi:hypothetical protein